MLETSWNYGFILVFENLRPSKTLCEHPTKNQTNKQETSEQKTNHLVEAIDLFSKLFESSQVLGKRY